MATTAARPGEAVSQDTDFPWHPWHAGRRAAGSLKINRKRPCREGVPERTKGGREKVVTRAVASAAMLPFVEAEQGLHGTVRKFERKF